MDCDDSTFNHAIRLNEILSSGQFLISIDWFCIIPHPHISPNIPNDNILKDPSGPSRQNGALLRPVLAHGVSLLLPLWHPPVGLFNPLQQLGI